MIVSIICIDCQLCFHLLGLPSGRRIFVYIQILFMRHYSHPFSSPARTTGFFFATPILPHHGSHMCIKFWRFWYCLLKFCPLLFLMCSFPAFSSCLVFLLYLLVFLLHMLESVSYMFCVLSVCMYLFFQIPPFIRKYLRFFWVVLVDLEPS